MADATKRLDGEPKWMIRSRAFWATALPLILAGLKGIGVELDPGGLGWLFNGVVYTVAGALYLVHRFAPRSS